MKYARVLVAIAACLALNSHQANAFPLSNLVSREFVQPSLKVNPEEGSFIQDGFPESLTVEIPHSSRTLTLKLSKNTDLLSPDYSHVFLDGDAQVLSTQPVLEKPDCYYHGVVDGEQGSIVAVDLCSDSMQGFIQTQHKTFSLEAANMPVLHSSNTAAVRGRSAVTALSSPVVMVDVNEEEGLAAPVPCGSHVDDAAITEAANDSTTDKTSDAEDIPVPDVADDAEGALGGRRVKYVEILAFNDHARHAAHGDNTAANTLTLMNNIAAYYRHGAFKYDVRVVLKGQVSFSAQDPYRHPLKADGSVQVTGNNGLLNLFNHYRARNLSRLVPHDLGMLFSGLTFEASIRGLANVGAVCSHATLSGNVCQVTFRNPVTNSVLSAHELGHLLGMQHDGQNNECRSADHIMQPYVSTKTTWSACSKRAFNAYMDALTCMNNNPHSPARTTDSDAQPDGDADTHREGDVVVDDDGVVYIDEATVAVLCLATAAATAMLVLVCVLAAKKRREKQQQQQQQQQQHQQQFPSAYPMAYPLPSPHTPHCAPLQHLPPGYVAMSPGVHAPLAQSGPVFVYPVPPQEPPRA